MVAVAKKTTTDLINKLWGPLHERATRTATQLQFQQQEAHARIQMQQQLLQQQALMGSNFNDAWTTAGNNFSIGFDVPSAPYHNAGQVVYVKEGDPPTPPGGKPETPLEWLDRRIDEVRVTL